MRRADRLFDIIQRLRAAPRPLTAAALADELEVTPRTIYRDVAALQASRVPIEGAPGIGYVLRRGFDLPPLMFTADEIDAIAVGARHVRRLRDPQLQQAADSREGVLRCCPGFRPRRGSSSRSSRSHGRTNMSSISKVVAAQSRASRRAPPTTTRSIRKANCTAR